MASPHDQETFTENPAEDPTLDLPIAERKGRRTMRKPARFRDEIPEGFTTLAPHDVAEPLRNVLNQPCASISCAITQEDQSRAAPCVATAPILQSSRNVFGLFRKYSGEKFPSHDPEEELTLIDLRDVEQTSAQEDGVVTSISPSPEQSYGPYPNESSFLLGEWYWNDGVQKSKRSFKNLVNIVSSPDFQPADVRDTNWDLIDERLGGLEGELEWEDVEFDATWTCTPVEIRVPHHSRSANPGIQTYTFPNFYHRSIVAIIREKITNVQEFRHLHLDPFELHWQPGPVSTKPVQVYGELYTSPAFIEAHQNLQDSPPEPSCTLPWHVIALMFASDTTHLTAFGDAKIWPLYMFFGNDSKYRRCKPSLHLCNHVAYFQKVCKLIWLTRLLTHPSLTYKLPDEFKDFAALHAGAKGPSDALLTYCIREFFHAQWKIILDDEFMDAYSHGIVILCPDGLQRRFYPRIFVYSADYQEK